MADYKRVYVSRLDQRSFLVVEWDENGGIVIPIDKIKKVDMLVGNGGCDNSVQIEVDNDGESEYFHFAYDGADMVREFFRNNNIH